MKNQQRNLIFEKLFFLLTEERHRRLIKIYDILKKEKGKGILMFKLKDLAERPDDVPIIYWNQQDLNMKKKDNREPNTNKTIGILEKSLNDFNDADCILINVSDGKDSYVYKIKREFPQIDFNETMN